MARDVSVNIIGRDLASPAFLKAAASADTAAGRMNAAGKRMDAMGRRMTHTLTLPILAIGAASVKMSTDFAASMTRIQTQAGGSARDVRVLSRQVLALAKNAQQGPNELAKSLYHLKSVGMDNVSAMRALKQSSDLASVSHSHLEETTNALAGAWRTGIRGAKNFHGAVATLNAIVGAGNMSMTDLTDALGTGILPSAKTFGLTLKDVGSALALFTDEGVPANAAATRLRMSFSLLGAPSKIAEGQLSKIGLTGLKLANDMRKPNGLVVAIGDLKKHLDGSGLSLSKQAQLLSHAFGGGRSSSAILSMVNNWDVMRKKQDQVTAGIGKYGAAVQTQRKTASAQFALMVSSLQRAGIQIGNALIPYVLAVARKIGDLAEKFNGLTPAARKMIIVGALVVAGLGPALRIIGNLTRATSLLWRGGAAFVGWARTAVLSFGRVVAGARMAEISMAGMTTRSYATGLRLRGVFTSIGTAAAGFGRSIGGAFRNAGTALSGIPAAVRGAEGAGSKIAAIGTGAAGAGAAIAPLAVGILGVTAAVVGGMAVWNHYKQQQADAAAQVNDLTAALERDNGAIGANTRATVAQQLQQKGAFQAAHTLGLSVHDVTNAAMGQSTALDRVNARMRLFEIQLGAAADGGGFLTGSADDANSALNKMHGILGNESGAIKNAAGKARDMRNALGQQATQTQTTASVTDRLTSSLNKLGGGALDTAQASVSFRQSLSSLTADIKTNGAALRGNSTVALENRQAVLSALQAAQQHAQALTAQGKSAKYVAGALAGDVQSLIDTAVHAGMSRGAIVKLLRSMGLMPKQITTKINADTTTARQRLDALILRQNQLHDKTITYTVRGFQTGVRTTAPGNAIATGGTVHGPGTGTSDSVLARLSTGEEVINAKQAGKHRSLLKAINAGTQGFASGGTVRNASMIAAALRALGVTRSGIAGALGNFEEESSLRSGAWNPREQARGFAQWEGGRRTGSGGLIAFARRMGLGEKSARAQVAFMVHELRGGYSGVLNNLRHSHSASAAAAMFDAMYEGSSGSSRGAREANARRFYGSVPALVRGGAGISIPGGGGGGGRSSGPDYVVQGKHYATYRAALNAAHADYKRQRASGLHINTKDIANLNKAVKGTATEAHQAFHDMLLDAQKLGINDHLTKTVQAENKRLDKEIQARNKLGRRLTNANAALKTVLGKYTAEVAAVRGSVTSTFDITTAGTGFDGQQKVTGGNILAQEGQAVAKAKRFVRLARLLGKRMNGPYFRALIEKGPDALPQIQALLSLTPSQMRTFTQGEASLAASGTAIGKYQAGRMYNTQIKADRAAVRSLERAENASAREIRNGFRHLENQLERAVHDISRRPVVIKVNDREIAKVTASGTKRLNR